MNKITLMVSPGWFMALLMSATPPPMEAASDAQLQIDLVPKLTLLGESNTVYRLEYTEQISDPGTWSVLTNLTIFESPSVYVDIRSTSGAKRFYRVAVVSPFTNATIQPPAILTQPVDASGVAGSAHSFLIEARGTEPLSYQWYHNGQALHDATNALLELSNIQSSLAGEYLVLVNNSGGSTVSRAVGLMVLPPVSAPRIIEEPASQQVYVGSTARIQVRASGLPVPTYQWYRNGVKLTDSTKRMGTQTPVLSITNVQTTDAGKYLVVASNSLGVATSLVAQLTVSPAPLKPVIQTPPKNQSVKAGANLTLTVAATGTAPLRYQWFFNTVPIPSGTNATLVLTQVSEEQSGEYQVVVSNAAGEVASPKAVVAVYELPRITRPPQAGEVWAGEPFAFAVEASGTEPLSYQWRKNGSNIRGATNHTYHISSATFTNSGAYSVVIKNWAGSITSGEATLTVHTFAPDTLTGMNLETINDAEGSRTLLTFLSATQAAQTDAIDFAEALLFNYQYTRITDNTGRVKNPNAGPNAAKDVLVEFSGSNQARGTGIKGDGTSHTWTIIIHSRDAHLAPLQLQGQTWRQTKMDGDVSYLTFDTLTQCTLSDRDGSNQLDYQYQKTGNNTARVEVVAPGGAKATVSLYFTSSTRAVAVVKDFGGVTTVRLLTRE